MNIKKKNFTRKLRNIQLYSWNLISKILNFKQNQSIIFNKILIWIICVNFN